MSFPLLFSWGGKKVKKMYREEIVYELLVTADCHVKLMHRIFSLPAFLPPLNLPPANELETYVRHCCSIMFFILFSLTIFLLLEKFILILAWKCHYTCLHFLWKSFKILPSSFLYSLLLYEVLLKDFFKSALASFSVSLVGTQTKLALLCDICRSRHG